MTPVSPPKAAVIVFAIACVVVAYIALTHSLGITEFWAGFLWLFYWASIEKMDLNRIVPSTLGALLGLATASALRFLPEALGGISEINIGLILALCLIVALVYCLVMGWFATVINDATMLYLTVMTISHVQASGDFLGILEALLLGVAFFGGLLWLASKIPKKAEN